MAGDGWTAARRSIIVIIAVMLVVALMPARVIIITWRTVVAWREVDRPFHIPVPVHIDDFGLRPTVTPGGDGGSRRAADGASQDRAVAPAQFGADGRAQSPP
jgi:hypothetical protein